LLISEYHSLSTTKFPVVKNFLKRLLNKKGKYFIFLNERVRSGYCFFRNRKNFFYRSMGYDEEAVALAHSGAKKEYDFVYFGSVNRKGVIDNIVRIAELGYSLAVVGCAQEDIEYLAKKKNISPYPKLGQQEVYRIAA